MPEQPSPTKPLEALPPLTSLRFFAALAVLVFHASFIIDMPQAIRPLINQGRTGVSFFFVLSGFVLTYNYLHRFGGGVTARDWRAFARARFARVFPMHAVALLLLTPGIVWLLWLGLLGLLEWPRSVPLLSLSWLLNLTGLHVWVPIKWVQELWNVPSWSIGCEAFFYALFPFAIHRLIAPTKGLRSLVLLMGVLWLGQALMFSGTVYLLHEWFPAHDDRRWWLMFLPERMPLFRVWEFLIGCTLGTLFLRCRALPAASALRRALDRGWLRNLLLALALAGITALPFYLPYGKLGEIIEYGRWYLFYTPLFATIIFLSAWGRTLLSPLLENRLSRLLGEASYSLYVLHWLPVIMITYLRVMYPYGMHWLTSQETARNAMLAVLPAALVCYWLIEVPARCRLRGRPRPIADKAPADALAP